MRRAVKSAFRKAGSLTRAACDLAAGERRGFSLKDGALSHGKGAAVYEGSAGKYILPPGVEPEALYFLSGTDCFSAAAYAGGQMYVCLTDGGAFASAGVRFEKAPACVRVYDGEEALVLSDGESVCVFNSDGLTQTEEIPPFSCGGYAYDRLWLYTGGGDAHRVRFSALRDIYGFGEEGENYIDFPDGRGEIAAFAELNGAFYLFRRYGVQKLDAKGTEDEFSLSDEPAPFTEVYAVCTENGRAYVLTERGMYRFGDAQSFYPAFAEKISSAANRNARMAACGGKVYLAAEFDGEAGLGVFSEDGKDGFVCPCECAAMTAAATPAGARVLFYRGGDIYAVSEGGSAPAEWKSGGVSPFGGEECVLEELALTAEGSFALCVCSERGERSFEIVCRGTKRMRAALAGARFCFKVISKGENGKVFSLTAGYSRNS